VQDIKITMEPQQVLLNFKEGKTLSDEKIAEIIKDAGINVDKIERK
jgi:ribosomal protein L12E/L44/L45/RPP1/RPP2